jgi:hypothetical protein
MCLALPTVDRKPPRRALLPAPVSMLLGAPLFLLILYLTLLADRLRSRG